MPKRCIQGHCYEALQIRDLGVLPISGVRAFPPGSRTPFHVQQGNNQHAVGADLVKHSVWEAPYDASPGSLREKWPCLRIRGDPGQRALYFLR
jgi:hypothetical protein